MNTSDQPASFPTTRWSLVAHAVNPAAPEARAALAALCGAYWYPMYAFIRRKGHDPEEALDLTQDYFARLLKTGVLAAADHRLGRFRAFLRTDCGFFLSHNHERRQAIKRGGGQRTPAIDARDGEGRYQREPTDAMTPERLFDQSWAVNLLDEVLKQLACSPCYFLQSPALWPRSGNGADAGFLRAPTRRGSTRNGVGLGGSGEVLNRDSCLDKLLRDGGGDGENDQAGEQPDRVGCGTFNQRDDGVAPA